MIDRFLSSLLPGSTRGQQSSRISGIESSLRTRRGNYRSTPVLAVFQFDTADHGQPQMLTAWAIRVLRVHSRPCVSSYVLAGSFRSGSKPISARASARPASILPSRASADSVACTIASAEISKKCPQMLAILAAPEAVRPSEFSRRAEPRRKLIRHRLHIIRRRDDRTRATLQARARCTASRGFSAGCSRFQRSTSSASRRSSL